MVRARDTMFNTDTEVIGENNGVLRLKFMGGVRTVQRRRHPRIAIELCVSFRIMQEIGCFSSWRNGVSRDLSAGGMGLVLEKGMAIPRSVELLFSLPDQATDSSTVGTDEHVEILKLVAASRPSTQRASNKERPIKALARVCGHSSLPEGRTLLRLAFTGVSPVDRARLREFLNAPWHTIV